MAYLCDFWQCWYVVSTYQRQCTVLHLLQWRQHGDFNSLSCCCWLREWFVVFSWGGKTCCPVSLEITYFRLHVPVTLLWCGSPYVNRVLKFLNLDLLLQFFSKMEKNASAILILWFKYVWKTQVQNYLFLNLCFSQHQICIFFWFNEKISNQQKVN